MRLDLKPLLFSATFVCMFIIAQPFFLKIFKTKCLDELGCFYNGPPFFHPLLRPISLLPFDLKAMKTKFWLYTPSSNRTQLNTNAKSITESAFDKKFGLHVVIHGYKETLTGPSLQLSERMINGIQKANPTNIIQVDYTASNQADYPQAVANARVVGAQVAQLIKLLQNVTGLDPKNVHIIGQSLGAHVAGWAGERIKNLGRITGLDPAGPYFRRGKKEIRLDRTDANFVDIIHTNAASLVLYGLGIDESIGHMDFYVSGGNNQPGCEPTLKHVIIAGVNKTVPQGTNKELIIKMCNHVRAIELFIASINECQFMATECKDYTKFKTGKCSLNEEVIMGFHGKKVPQSKGSAYYVTTSRIYPFC